MESVADFRVRARNWLRDNMPRLTPDAAPWNMMGVTPKQAARAKELQRRLYDGGFAGLCYPQAYGGQGLSREYQVAFSDEAEGYELPLLFNIPTLTIIGPTILDLGSEAQKKRFLPAMIRGDELWVQLMSEPSGGSDLAGAITRATPDGDNFRLTGSKIWSSYAYFSDYGLCLARTDWNQVKHQGLSMFIVKLDAPGVTINRIKQSDGGIEFCEEFFDEVVLPSESLVGALNEGWSAAQTLLSHESSATGGASPYALGKATRRRRESIDDLVELARRVGKIDDQHTRQLLGEAYVLQRVQEQCMRRVVAGVNQGALPPKAGTVLRLSGDHAATRRTDIAFEIAGASAVAWDAEAGGKVGNEFIFRQASCLGGGSTEMQRNMISERVLDMPREPAADRGIPFKDVRRSRTKSD